MTTSSYGVDVKALDDLPDPEELAVEEENVAYAIARRLAQDSDALEEIGDDDEYDSINMNDWLGGDFDLTDRTVLDDLQQQATQVIFKDPRVLSVVVQASYATGRLSLNVQAQGSNGPFSFVLSVDGVSAPLLEFQP